MDPTYPLVPIINLLAMILGLILVATRNFKSWNIGLAVGAVSAAITCLCIAINTIIWSNNVVDSAPVWCDISTHVMVACGDALPASSFVLTRQLFKITRLKSMSSNHRERRSQLLFDLTICVALPLANLVFYFIGQSRRYVIIEEYGCGRSTASAGLPSVLPGLLPFLTSSISAVYYCPRILRSYYERRKELNQLFVRDRYISRSAFIRASTMSIMQVAILFPSNILLLVRPFLQGTPIFWPGWKTIHSAEWWTIPQYPTAEWETFGFWYIFNIKWHEWGSAAYAVSFFLLFGLHAEARDNYQRSFRSIYRFFGKSTDKPAQTDTNFASFVAANPDLESSEVQ